MEIKVNNEFYNPLLKRKEITLEIEHTGEGTPQRFDIRKRMASKLNAKIENVFVVSLDTSTGLQRSTCALQVYDDSRAASSTVPEHLATRNLPPEERAKVKEAKAAKPEKAAKPVEKREAKPKESEAKPAAKPEQTAQAEPAKPAK
jgi:small subunit ribosomal protein S24e